VLQPTPFCNIDCRYCYLPDRRSKRRMSEEVLDAVFARVFEGDLVQGPFTVVWHAGEPLVLPPSWYERAFAIAAARSEGRALISHSFQTNGILIDDEWCELIRERRLHVGVSIDGPDFLHDRYRVTRRGRGTHAAVLAGIARLKRSGIPFHVITVLTRETLDYPDELFAFYREQEIGEVGFNVEEIEGPHRGSSLEGAEAEQCFRRFLARFFELTLRSEGAVRVRELDGTLAAILHGGEDRLLLTQETAPFAIVTVDCEGNYGTFSPELLGLESPTHGDFSLGNVLRGSFADAARSERFRSLHGAIAAGIERCRAECRYYGFCGGGAPVNKLCENGGFDTTETLFCRLNRKATLDAVLDHVARTGGGRSPRTLAAP
jgi:uncharacterized protein